MNATLPRSALRHLHQLDEAIHAVEQPLRLSLRLSTLRPANRAFSQRSHRSVRSRIMMLHEKQRASLADEFQRGLEDAVMPRSPFSFAENSLGVIPPLPMSWDETIYDVVESAHQVLRDVSGGSVCSGIRRRLRRQSRGEAISEADLYTVLNRPRTLAEIVLLLRLLATGLEHLSMVIGIAKSSRLDLPAMRPTSLVINSDEPYVAIDRVSYNIGEEVRSFISELAAKPRDRLYSARHFSRDCKPAQAFHRMQPELAALADLIYSRRGRKGGYMFHHTVKLEIISGAVFDSQHYEIHMK